MGGPEVSLYDLLGVASKASASEIRRAYRNLVTREHPDKGGDADKFKAIQKAYDVLSADDKRKVYDTTGRVERSVDEEFMESFGGGSYRDSLRKHEEDQANMAEQLAVRQTTEFSSHTGGLEAWMRSRGDKDQMTFGVDDVIERYGVEKSSYELVPLPKIQAHTVVCSKAGDATEVLKVTATPIPAALEWGEVMVSVRAAPISPADIYTARLGGEFGDEAVVTPYTAGHDGVGLVQKVGPGVKGLKEGDWVLPFKTHMGFWRSLLVASEKSLITVPTDLMPFEYLAMWREMCTAYRLLEDQKSLKPGDCVILNAANSTVGQTLIQLCHILRLRCIAVMRGGTLEEEKREKLTLWLKSLGATEVCFEDQAKPLKAQLEGLKFFAKPKLALDSVGGHSVKQIADMLEEGGKLIVYGCMSGKPLMLPWQQWVFDGIDVQGFNLRKWMKNNKKKIPTMLEALAKLVNAKKIELQYTEYELGTEFEEALEHHLIPARNTKILLKVADFGTAY